jgi:AcrR family transcriptional regulator
VRSPYDDVKVSDIAALADLTPAAVHYHFDGKEQILLEAMRDFSDELLLHAEGLVADHVDIEQFMSAMLAFIRTRRTAATVFFVSSAGLSLSVEARRKLVRAELAVLLTKAVKADGKRRSASESAVVGAALVSLVEVSATRMLRGDDDVRAAGTKRLNEVVGSVALRILT